VSVQTINKNDVVFFWALKLLTMLLGFLARAGLLDIFGLSFDCFSQIHRNNKRDKTP